MPYVHAPWGGGGARHKTESPNGYHNVQMIRSPTCRATPLLVSNANFSENSKPCSEWLEGKDQMGSFFIEKAEVTKKSRDTVPLNYGYEYMTVSQMRANRFRSPNFRPLVICLKSPASPLVYTSC